MNHMKCRACGHNKLKIFHAQVKENCRPDREADLWDWYKCQNCGSDTSTEPDPDAAKIYDADYPKIRLTMLNQTSDLLNVPLENVRSAVEWSITEYNTNVDYINSIRDSLPDNTVLEIGSCEGSGITAFERQNYEAQGWDLMPPTICDKSKVTIGKCFSADQMEKQFSVVILREVIEHVTDWESLLKEIHAVLLPEGVLQVQTPLPCSKRDGTPYQQDHIVIFSANELQRQLIKHKFIILSSLYWECGQMVMVKKI